MKKNILVYILLFIMILGLTACGNGANSKDASKITKSDWITGLKNLGELNYYDYSSDIVKQYNNMKQIPNNEFAIKYVELYESVFINQPETWNMSNDLLSYLMDYVIKHMIPNYVKDHDFIGGKKEIHINKGFYIQDETRQDKHYYLYFLEIQNGSAVTYIDNFDTIDAVTRDGEGFITYYPSEETLNRYYKIDYNNKKLVYYISENNKYFENKEITEFSQEFIDRINNNKEYNEFVQFLIEVKEECIPAVNKRIQQINSEAEAKYRDSQRRKNAEPAIGMSKSDVLEGAWGSPNKKNITETAYGVHEQWVYSNGRYVYFDNGIVTAIQR